MISSTVFCLNNPLQQNIILAEAMQVFTRPPHREEVTVAEQGEDLMKHLSWQFVDVYLVVTLHHWDQNFTCFCVSLVYILPTAQLLSYLPMLVRLYADVVYGPNCGARSGKQASTYLFNQRFADTHNSY